MRVAVIGAGVIGLAAAYYLSQGKKDVLVIEKYDSFGEIDLMGQYYEETFYSIIFF